MEYTFHGAELQLQGVDSGVVKEEELKLSTVTIVIDPDSEHFDDDEGGNCDDVDCAGFNDEMLEPGEELVFHELDPQYESILANEEFTYRRWIYSPCMYTILTRTKAEKKQEKPRYFAIIKKVVTIKL